MRTMLVLLAAIGAAATPVRAQIPDTFTNLRVLPEDIARDSLIAIMRGFSLALDVRCQYCHVGGDGASFEGVRFADDDDEDKRKARAMMQMTRTINEELLARLPDRDQPAVGVSCVTCHGGLARPETLEGTLGRTIDRVGETAGADSAVAHYRRLRETYYGTGAYDFGPLRLAELARSLVAAGKTGAALRMLTLNTEVHPGDAPTWGQLAETHLSAGDTTAAIAAYEKVLEIQPRNPVARRRLGEIRR